MNKSFIVIVNIEWFSDKDMDWKTGIKAAFELYELYFSWLFAKFFELYSKRFELHDYVRHLVTAYCALCPIASRGKN